ncbi:Uncharacterised protein [Collinsella sp. AK_207A]|nr:Uncharacterised protein [Collinsella sp. AK_207A]
MPIRSLSELRIIASFVVNSPSFIRLNEIHHIFVMIIQFFTLPHIFVSYSIFRSTSHIREVQTD